MIYLDILGRCGNQMFQYAFARRLAELRDDEITVNFSLLDSYEVNGEQFQNELKNFSASENYISESGGILRVRERGSASQIVVFRLYSLVRKLYGKFGRDPHEAEKLFRLFLSRFGIYLECHIPDKAFVLKKTGFRNVFIKGYFENPVYYDSVSDELKNDFKLVKQVSANASDLINKAKRCNSVCVSFRKWSIGGREVCGEEYYRKAFDYFLNNIDDPVFVVFSNDVDWVRTHFMVGSVPGRL